MNLSPLDAFRLVSLIDALPTQWRESLKTCISTVVTLRHPSKGGPVETSSDDGIKRDPSRLRVVGLKLALCELVGQQTEETVVETFLIYY